MNTADSTTNQPAKANAPTHIAYHVREVGTGQSKKSFWTRIGAAWVHERDGKGMNIQLDCMPLDGRITLRVPEDDKQQ